MKTCYSFKEKNKLCKYNFIIHLQRELPQTTPTGNIGSIRVIVGIWESDRKAGRLGSKFWHTSDQLCHFEIPYPHKVVGRIGCDSEDKMQYAVKAWGTIPSPLYHYDQQMAGDFEVSIHNMYIHPPP